MSETANEVWQGYPPVLAVRPGNPEAMKYGQIWERAEYRIISPGEFYVPVFLMQARPRPGASLIDFGCGTGRAGRALAQAGLRVTMVDFVNNCLDADVREALGDGLSFVKADLEQPIPVTAEYGFCCDVMEHIPEARVDRVLKNVLMAAQHVFFAISTVEDRCGELIGESLHLTTQPYAWWLEQFTRHECVVYWSRDLGRSCLFYVTAWQDGQAVVDHGVVNTEEEQVRVNVRHNVARGWTQVTPHETNDFEVMILGGGPSMAAFEDEIKARRAAGAKLVTLNGGYHWALDHGLTPSAQIIVDARAFNARFTKPVVDECKYLIASQVDPSVFEGLPLDRTFIWHTTAEQIEDILKESYGVYWPIPGGSTVLLRAIPLLRMLGYRKFHLYGCDSCLAGDGTHHAYAQPENDAAPIFPVTLGGRIFQCHPWMAAQCQEMLSLIRFMGDEIELEIHGDGLLAWALEHAASLAGEEVITTAEED